jgi:hypothetical protein
VETTPEATQEHATIIALLIGGALALAGTVLSQFFGLWAGWIDNHRRHKALLRERFEELTQCLSNSLYWTSTIGSLRTVKEMHACPPPPETRRMFALTLIYFPELRAPVSDYVHILVEYQIWAVGCADPNGVEMVGEMMGRNPVCGQKMAEIRQSRERLDDAIEKAAPNYASA